MNLRTTWTLLGARALLLGLYALAGFALLPTLLERKAPTFAAERLGAELSFGDNRFNPFLLRLVAKALRLARVAEPPLLALERLARADRSIGAKCGLVRPSPARIIQCDRASDAAPDKLGSS